MKGWLENSVTLLSQFRITLDGAYRRAFVLLQTTTIFVGVVILFACGCTTPSARSAMPSRTPYNTNATARAVYIRFYKDACRIAAAGRTNISHNYTGSYDHAAIDGQKQGISDGIKLVQEHKLRKLARNPHLPQNTPFDDEPKLRSVYLRSYRASYIAVLKGHCGISCFPGTRTATAHCIGEQKGQLQAECDRNIVEEQCAIQFAGLMKCLPHEHAEADCVSVLDWLAVFRKLSGF